MVGNFFDGIDDGGDLVGLLVEIFDDFGRWLNCFGNFVYFGGCVVDDVGVFLGNGFGILWNVVCFFGVVVYLIDIDWYFFDWGCYWGCCIVLLVGLVGYFFGGV